MKIRPQFPFKARQGTEYAQSSLEIKADHLHSGDGILYGENWEQVLSVRIDATQGAVIVATVDTHDAIHLRTFSAHDDQTVVVRRRWPCGQSPTDEDTSE
jgi:hypothetical protein